MKRPSHVTSTNAASVATNSAHRLRRERVFAASNLVKPSMRTADPIHTAHVIAQPVGHADRYRKRPGSGTSGLPGRMNTPASPNPDKCRNTLHHATTFMVNHTRSRG